MNFKEYQEQAKGTARYPALEPIQFMYFFMAFRQFAELAERMKKLARDNQPLSPEEFNLQIKLITTNLNHFKESVLTRDHLKESVEFKEQDEPTKVYTALGLIGEVGELFQTVEYKARVKELGDVLWYLTDYASQLNISMEEVSETNIAKLKLRAEKGMISGNGDNREEMQ